MEIKKSAIEQNENWQQGASDASVHFFTEGEGEVDTHPRYRICSRMFFNFRSRLRSSLVNVRNFDAPPIHNHRPADSEKKDSSSIRHRLSVMIY
ncbi:hypothetical protein TNCV_3743421 [Trichonephila clavipes]|nr:hypothetical protein TNCV_3743421 [Trichonephila clavipes]